MAKDSLHDRLLSGARRAAEIPLVGATLIFILATATLATGTVKGSESEPDLIGYLLVVVMTVAVYFRRRFPLPATAVGAASTVTYWVSDYPGAIEFGLALLLYNATRHGGSDRRRVWAVTGGAIAATTITATIGVLAPIEDLPAIAVPGVLAMHTTFALIGEATYQRARHIAELEARNRALEADLDTQARLAVVDERNRIAREMHDIIAHGMSSVVVQAAAAQRVLDNDPQAARTSLGAIENIGRESVNEMRRMLGILRNVDADGEREPQPAITDFGELVQRANDAGVETTMEIVGQTRPAPPGVELTGYRVIQEALTNVVRHAGRPVAAEVAVTYAPTGIEVRVTDDGLGAAASTDSAGSGLGLVGMRERVEIYDGDLHAGPRPNGGYEVRAFLPTAAVPAAAS